MTIKAEDWRLKSSRDYFVNRELRRRNVYLNVDIHFRNNSQYYISFNLDHLEKEKIEKLISEGKLRNEVLFLYDLAHLPYAEVWLMGVNIDEHTKFKIIDCVLLSIEGTYAHPYLGDDSRIEEGIAWIKQRVESEKKGQEKV